MCWRGLFSRRTSNRENNSTKTPIVLPLTNKQIWGALSEPTRQRMLQDGMIALRRMIKEGCPPEGMAEMQQGGDQAVDWLINWSVKPYALEINRLLTEFTAKQAAETN